MSNRKVDPKTGKKVYVPRAVRRMRRNERRAAHGAPPERPVPGTIPQHSPSYLGQVETFDPVTGEVVEPAHTPPADHGGINSTFIVEGLHYVYKGLGGPEGFLRWARTHPTKFYELATKLLPSQVQLQADVMNRHVTIQHALPPPAGYASRTVTAGSHVFEGRTIDVELVEQVRQELSKQGDKPTEVEPDAEY